MTFWKVVKVEGAAGQLLGFLGDRKMGLAPPQHTHTLCCGFLPVTEYLTGTLKEGGLLWVTRHRPQRQGTHGSRQPRVYRGEGPDFHTSQGKWAGQTDIGAGHLTLKPHAS